jgi:type I restriction enzyme R subunit
VKPEEKARQQIDGQLEAAGWVVQSLNELNLGAAFGVAVREFPLKNGFADYLLFVDRKAVGVLEAKAEGTTLSDVANQPAKYTAGVSANLPHVQEPLPFSYQSTGSKTVFNTGIESEPCQRWYVKEHGWGRSSCLNQDIPEAR